MGSTWPKTRATKDPEGTTSHKFCRSMTNTMCVSSIKFVWVSSISCGRFLVILYNEVAKFMQKLSRCARDVCDIDSLISATQMTLVPVSSRNPRRTTPQVWICLVSSVNVSCDNASGTVSKKRRLKKFSKAWRSTVKDGLRLWSSKRLEQGIDWLEAILQWNLCDTVTDPGAYRWLVFLLMYWSPFLLKTHSHTETRY